MCRRNQLWGCCMIALGLGLLIGLCIASGLVGGCLGVGAVVLGLCLIQRK